MSINGCPCYSLRENQSDFCDDYGAGPLMITLYRGTSSACHPALATVTFVLGGGIWMGSASRDEPLGAVGSIGVNGESGTEESPELFDDISMGGRRLSCA